MRAMMESAMTSALQKASLRDRTSFVASPRRAMRVRSATAEEKAAASIEATTDAAAVLIRLCNKTCKIVVVKRELMADVTESARVLADAHGRPFKEAMIAASYFPAIPVNDLCELARAGLDVRLRCAKCQCGAAYIALVFALARAAAWTAARPWTVTSIDGRVNEVIAEVKAAAPAPIRTDLPCIRAESAAIRQITEAAGYLPPPDTDRG
jgi:hypothetical protein